MNNQDRNTANWTGRTPRTMEEAFGPHTRDTFSETTQKGSMLHAMASLFAVIVVVILIVLAGTPTV